MREPGSRGSRRRRERKKTPGKDRKRLVSSGKMKKGERRRRVIEQKKKKRAGKGERRMPGSMPTKKRGTGKAYESAKRTSDAGKKRKEGVAKTRIGRNTINSNKETTMEEEMREVPLKKVVLTTAATPEERAAVLRPKGGDALSTNTGPSTQKFGLD